MALCALGIAVLLERHSASTAGPVPTGTVPTRIRRRDLGVGPDGWLLVLFSSSDCSSCARVRDRISTLAGPDVAIREVDHRSEPELHRRYGIDTVPLTVLVDRSGEVGLAVLGPVDDHHLAEIASHLDPGHGAGSTTPPPAPSP